MDQGLPKISVALKTGNERFHHTNDSSDFTLLDFWRWSCSDLVSNATRGIVAEFIVARALGIDTEANIRDEWQAYDLLLPPDIKIEIKSAAYIQSWYQKSLSTIQFLAPKKRGWDAETNKLDIEVKRHANVYVFALLAHKDKITIDPLNITQWQFYVLPTSVLNTRKRSQHSITLKSLEVLAGACLRYDQLKHAVLEAASMQDPVGV